MDNPPPQRELTRKIHVKAHLFSEAAEKKITAAGGTIEKLPMKGKKTEAPSAQ